MGFLDRAFSSEPPEVAELRKKAKDFEKGFEARGDYDDLQNYALCDLEISLIHPDERKQTTAFMEGRNSLEKAISEANTESLQPKILNRAIEIFKEKGKSMFLRSLFDLMTQGLERFLDRMKTVTMKQLNRERLALAEVLKIYNALGSEIAQADTKWFEEKIISLEKAAQSQSTPGVQQRIHRIHDVGGGSDAPPS